jgi:isopentenyl diphosphate isomerase/L-lactate dehydrogenase-like FMN-dependent dehydrogenase
MMTLNRRDLVQTGLGIGLTMAAAAPAVAQSAAMPQGTPPPASGGASAADQPVPATDHHINIVTLRDLEAEAEKVLPAYSFAYVAGGAGDEWTMRENEAAINRWVIEPNFLSGHAAPDLATTLFGSKISTPIITAPVASHALFNTAAEAASAKGTDQAGSIYVSSSESSLRLEDVAAASQGPKWFQIYFPSDRGYARELLQRAKSAGYKVIVITVDATVTSNRERVMRILGAPTPDFHLGNKPTTAGIDPLMAQVHKRDLNWDDVAFCGAETGLPVVVKSIISVNNVVQAIERGCAGVWISNHGGRQLDNSAAPMTVLPRIADAVKGRVPIIVDGGFRRGQDVFRAIALGASAVALGRPIIYGLSLGGANGVQGVLQHMKTELQMVMQLSGVASIKDIDRKYVAPQLI